MPYSRVLIAAVLTACAGFAMAQAPAPADPAPAAPAAAPAAAERDPDTYFKGKMGGTFGKDIVEVMPAAKRIAVAAFRVAFVTDNKVSAQVRSSYLLGRDTSGAHSSYQVTLTGVDARTMQAITDKAYADLLAQLAASGREVVPLDQMKEFFGVATVAPQPYVKELNGQTVSFFAPTGMPLMFTHFDGGWGNLSAFDLNNLRRVQEYSSKWDAAVITPMVFVNFAQMSSSGNQSGLVARRAETGAELGMSVTHLQSLYTRTEEFRNGMLMKGDEGGFNMANAHVASPMAFGTLRQTASEDNSAVKGIFDVLGRTRGMANAGGAARSSTKAVAESSNEAYAAAATDALVRTNAALASWFKKYPPAK